LILDAIEAALGAAAVTRSDGADPDERTRSHLSGRDLGTPIAWVRAADAEAIATVVRHARQARVAVVPVGAATAYWDPLRLGGAIALDTRALRSPITIDPIARVARAGAGVSVRELDQAARRHGLCLAARPDAGGETPIGALLAVGSTAGLGLGIASPIDLVAGATVVTGRGEIVRLGASHALHGVPFARDGAPDALGLVAAAEGRGAIIADVGLLLEPASPIVTIRARGKAPLPRLLASARAALDRGNLESFRIELSPALEVMARTIGRAGASEALDAASRLRAEWTAAGLAVSEPEIEPEAARRGEDPAYEYHWAFPAGEHRARLGGGAMWGVEAGVSWAAIEPCAARLWSLFAQLDRLPLLSKRLALYPAPHAITVGVQAIARRDARLDPLIALLAEALPDLLAHGAVPYRAGHLWRDALAAHGPPSLPGELLAALDPDGVIGVAPARPPARAIDARTIAEIADRYRRAIESGRPSPEPGPTPCLSTELRPLPSPAIAGPLAPLVEPCTHCGVAAACPGSLEPASAPRPLRPLRHADPIAATLAATRAIAAAWDCPAPAALEELLLGLERERLGARSLTPPPFELSLKIDGGRLVPALRVVEYSATGSWRAERGSARRRALSQLASRLAPAAPCEEWLRLVEAGQPGGLEVSIGFEAPLDPAPGDRIAPQLYAHIDPADRAKMIALAERVTRWSANLPSPAVLFERALDRPVELVLIAFSPRRHDPRQVKLYFSVPLALADPASALAPADPGPLARFAPSWGLAVLECGAAGLRWRKHDFPCAVHFQQAAALPDAFGAGLDDADLARVRRILAGDAFAPWPTWLSTSATGRVLYFIPR
jgi:hypothetical protein